MAKESVKSKYQISGEGDIISEREGMVSGRRMDP